MAVIVFGASGGTGVAVIRALLDAGETVTAFVRDPARLALAADRPAGLSVIVGDVMRAADVAAAIAGHDRVVVSLGNSQNPFALMLGAQRTTARDVCEVGTRHIIAGMQAHGCRRVVCVTAFGVGATRTMMPMMFKLFYAVVLREHMADKERQETLLRQSGLDWTIVQPVGLVDQPSTGHYRADRNGQIGKQTISRGDLAQFIVRCLDNPADIGQSLALSG
ncbi:MAG: NAD(P)-dependent oxidoreductase [Acidiphilium sp.]|jgi:uncharacterized protein YbjT (DUF2867 family)